MVKAKELSMGTRECIVSQRDSEDTDKDCRATLVFLHQHINS